MHKEGGGGGGGEPQLSIVCQEAYCLTKRNSSTLSFLKCLDSLLTDVK